MDGLRASHVIGFAGFVYAVVLGAAIAGATFLRFPDASGLVEDMLAVALAGRVDVQQPVANAIVLFGAVLAWVVVALPGLILMMLAGMEQASVAVVRRSNQLIRTNEAMLIKLDALRESMAGKPKSPRSTKARSVND